MKLAGFNFTKIDVEKKLNNLKDVRITTGIDILDLQEADSNLFKSSDELLAIKFEYKVNYEEEIASLRFQGKLVISIESKQAKEVLKQWKDEKIPEDFRLSIFNLILRKSSVKALQFEEEFGLPLHIPFPSLKSQEKKE